MDNDEFIRNFGGFIDRHVAASNEADAMDVDSVDFESEIHRIEREISLYKRTLQSCRDNFENTEMETWNAKQLQRKARFVLDNVRSEEEDLNEQFKNIRLNYEACVERSGYEDPDETIRANINKLTTQRKNLLEELVQLRKKMDDSGKKLARVNTMIAEQEEKNATQIRKLKEISESVSISLDTKKQIEAILRHQEISGSDDY